MTHAELVQSGLHECADDCKAVIPVEVYGRGRRCERCGCQWLLHLFDANPIEDDCASFYPCLCHSSVFCSAFEDERERQEAI